PVVAKRRILVAGPFGRLRESELATGGVDGVPVGIPLVLRHVDPAHRRAVIPASIGVALGRLAGIVDLTQTRGREKHRRNENALGHGSPHFKRGASSLLRESTYLCAPHRSQLPTTVRCLREKSPASGAPKLR